MEFSVKSNPIAGSADAILSDPDVRSVYSVFGDMVLACYSMDIREKKSYMSTRVLRQVQSFVGEYGREDAERIVRSLFSVPYKGVYERKTVGTSIFSSSWRWLADKLLLESHKAQGNDDVRAMMTNSYW